MFAVLLTGFVAYQQLPISALPEVDYPTIQIMTFYPGAVRTRHGLGHYRAPGKAIRGNARPQPNDIHQLGWQLSHHASV